MLRTRAAAAILALSCIATCGPTLLASAPLAGAAPPPSSSGAPATTGSSTAPPVRVEVLVQVPDLVGLTQDEVPKVLAAARLTLGTVTGTAGAPVSAQNPSAGSFIDPNVAIDITLGTATTTPAFVVVPDLRRSSVAHARRVLRALDLSLVSTARTGRVTKQDPAPNTVVARGSTVSVVTGSDVVVRYVEVPDLRGDSVDAARAALAGVGLTLSTPVGSGTVATQNPQPDQRAAVGSSVSVTIAVVAAPASAHPRRPLLYWVIGALALVALAVAGGSAAHRRQRTHRRHDRAPRLVSPAPRVTSRLVADTVRTTRGGPAGPAVELRTRERASLSIERIP